MSNDTNETNPVAVSGAVTHSKEGEPADATTPIDDRSPLPQIELTPKVIAERMDKFTPYMGRVTRQYGDIHYEVYPNRDPRLDEIEDWLPGQRR